LIVGLRSMGSDTIARLSPTRQPPALERAAWQQHTQAGRERLRQVALEAGVPAHQLGEAGRAQLLRFDQPLRGTALQDALRRLRLHPDVAWVEPNVRLQRLQATPTDPDWVKQWHLMAPATDSVSALNMPAAWAMQTGDTNVTVAVLDTGILPHPDLQGRVLPGYDFISEVEYANDGSGRDSDPSDPGDWVGQTGNNSAVQDLVNRRLCNVEDSSWHGTFIAGLIAANAHNGLGIAGVDWGARILPVRISGQCGAMLSDLLDGMRWAAGLPVAGVPDNPHPARIINLSFGGDASCSSSPLYQAAIDEVTARGALVVVASGNANTALKRPADCQRVLAVGAVGHDGLKTDYSSFGPELGLMAPGGSVEHKLYSTHNAGTTSPLFTDNTQQRAQNDYGLLQGSSFSAPLAAGVASLMLAVNPALSPAQLIERLRSSARPWSSVAVPGAYLACNPASLIKPGVCRCTSNACGAGLLDAGNAVQVAHNPAVLIDVLGSASPGAVLRLDGRASAAVAGANITRYQWQQTQGPTVSLSNASTAQAEIRLAAQGGVYGFELQVTDSAGRTGRDTVTLDVDGPSASEGGGGAHGLLWGAALWAWVLALLWVRGRSATLCQPAVPRPAPPRRAAPH
jgi:serine protease